MSDVLKHPELDKIKACQEDSQKIGDFIEWLSSQGYSIAEELKKDVAFYHRMAPTPKSTEQLLADYFKIDLKKAEEERQQILKSIR